MKKADRPDRPEMVAVLIRLPGPLVNVLDDLAQQDATTGFAPSRSRTLARMLHDAAQARPAVAHA